MGGLYRKKKGKSAGREKPRIEWVDYIGRKKESLQEEKGLGLNGKIIQEEERKVCRREKPSIEWVDYIQEEKGKSVGREKTRIKREDYIGRRKESLQKRKAQY